MARIGGVSTGDAGWQKHFDEARLAEPTGAMALENMRGRFNLAPGVGAAGLSESMVCAVPAAPPASLH